ncbi:MAG: tetratricopeptide repeat protein [Balneolaceae bacterium]
MVRKVLILLVITAVIGGCGSLKSNWDNFTAHYNTFYNADKSYEAGLDKVLNVKVEYSSEIPIRIHEVPVNSGAQDFEKAINKGADVLRKHPTSKWVDPSILIIGKSYYFRKEYYSAEQKFQELYQSTKDNDFVQRAVLWKSRVYLDMGLFDQGIQYLNEQLVLLEDIWTKKYIFEVKAMLAQFYVSQQNWELAIPLLEESVPNLRQKIYRERGFFLMGQVFDMLNEPDQALLAYKKVEDNYYDYNLQYLAKRKKAENARQLGDYKTALATFKEMVRDDKNVEFKPELEYEIGRTLQAMNSFKEAEAVYKELLTDKIRRPKPETMAKTYYGLAEIQRYGFSNFRMAAAYYDTAAKQNVNADKLPQNFMAGELSESFGAYSSIKNEIQHKDSLLWVASLPQAEFDELIVSLREKKLKQLIEEQRKAEQQQNVMVNLSNQRPSTPQSSSSNGFLNVRSPSLMAEGKNQFRAIWGDRALADNWRVVELLKNSLKNNNEDEASDAANNKEDNFGFTSADLEIDISNVPFSEAEQDSMKEQIATLKYELGNLFFLSLDMPDSANHYFSQVITNYPNSATTPVSYYSISELSFVNGDSLKARDYAETLIYRYPTSRYAKRLADKFKLPIEEDLLVEEATLTILYDEINADTSLTISEKAAAGTDLAVNNLQDPSAAVVLYKSTQEYINLAKNDEAYSQNISRWINQKQEWKEQSDSLNKHKKEAIEQLKDTTLVEAHRKELEELRDSTLPALDLSLNFPYEGEYWDLARSNLDLFLLYFKNSPLRGEVTTLKTELQKPVVKEVPKETLETNTELEGNIVGAFPTCNEIGKEAVVRGGIESFMNAIQFTSEDEPQPISYSFVINQRGIVQSFEVMTEDYPEELRAKIEDAFEGNLSFEPIIFEGEAITVQCTITFPFEY